MRGVQLQQVPFLILAVENQDKTTSFKRRGGYEQFFNEEEEKIDEAWAIIKQIFPKFNPKNSSLTATMDEFNRVTVKLTRQKSKEYPLFNSDDGELNKTITKIIHSRSRSTGGGGCASQ